MTESTPDPHAQPPAGWTPPYWPAQQQPPAGPPVGPPVGPPRRSGPSPLQRVSKWMRASWIPLLVGLVVGLVIGAGAASGSSSKTDAQPNPAVTVTTQGSPGATVTTTTTATVTAPAVTVTAQPPPPATDIKAGVYLVGTQIQPGTYQTQATACYWARLSGTSGSFDEIIANGNTKGPTVVTIAPSDAAFQSGCSWTKIG